MNISKDSAGFVLLTDICPDVMLDIRYYSTMNFIGRRIKGYSEPIALLTYEAAASLKNVSDRLLAQGYRLKIFDAYRPQEAVRDFKAWTKDKSDLKMKEHFYSTLNKEFLFEEGYIMENTGHSRGSTVDLTLFDCTTEKDVDMGGHFDFFGDLSHAEYRGITDTQYSNRKLLRKAMIDGGFEILDTEWWHFTLKNEPFKDTYFDFKNELKSLKST